jgi:hypothetical protein
MQALASALQKLKTFLDNQASNTTGSTSTWSNFNGASVFFTTYTTCKTQLETLLRTLQKRAHKSQDSRLRRTAAQLIWPLREDEHRRAITDLHRYVEVFQFALSVDGCAVLAQIADNVEEVLSRQAQWLGGTRRVCTVRPGLMDKVDEALGQVKSVLDALKALLDFTIEVAEVSKGVEGLKAIANGKV